MIKKTKKQKKNAVEKLPAISKYGRISYIFITSRYAGVRKLRARIESKMSNSPFLEILDKNLEAEFENLQREVLMLAGYSMAKEQALSYKLEELSLAQAEELNQLFLKFEQGKTKFNIGTTKAAPQDVKFVEDLYFMRKTRGERDGIAECYYMPNYWLHGLAVEGYGNILLGSLIEGIYGEVLKEIQALVDTPELLDVMLGTGIAINALFSEEASSYPASNTLFNDDDEDLPVETLLQLSKLRLIEMVEELRVVRAQALAKDDVENFRTVLGGILLFTYAKEKELTIDDAADAFDKAQEEFLTKKKELELA